MQAGPRKNMDRMAEVVPDADSRNLQQFVTHSKWDAQGVIDQVAREANDILGDDQRAGMLIDETSFAKQGTMSVGVARQWLGRLGKVDNRQVAVFGVLANGRFAAPVDVRLYLPKQWTEDPKRCEKAGIPEQERSFHTKDELALKIVAHARENGLQFGWVGADGGYGKGPGFCIALDQMGEDFVVDLHSDFRVYLEDPQPYIPEKTSRKGPKFTLLAPQTLGPKPETKISLCKAPETIELKTLAWRQLQRYWVERAFEDGKSECGMADEVFYCDECGELIPREV